MGDGDDGHYPLLLVDLIDHSEVASSCAALADELETQLAANPLGILRQRAVNELDAGGGGLFRQANETPKRRTGPSNFVGTVTHPLRRRANNSSPGRRSVRTAATAPSPLRIC